MNLQKLRWVWGVLVALGAVPSVLAQGQLLINEVLLNPPDIDTPNEYIELRGTPSYVIPQGTYFVAVEGDTNGNPGSVQNVFDLSGQRIGANGFLALLQKGNSYAINPNATTLVNTGSGPGWGSGLTSSIGHRGEGGQTEIENASATFFLVRSSIAPTFSQDIDIDNNGVPDGVFTNWVVLDSVGVLDSDGLGDIAYGAINFRRNNLSTASGTIVSIPFTASYVGRSTNSTGADSIDWVASNNLGGAIPNWTLDSTDTVPSRFAGLALSHIGAPNFGAGTIKGLALVESGGKTELIEGGSNDSYTIALNIAPAAAIVVRVAAPSPLRISTDGGSTFGVTRSLTFNSTAPQTVIVRAIQDNVVDTSPYTRTITHTITSSGDTARYPLSLPLAPVVASVTDKDALLLSELKVNPPGTNDVPFEYVELRGASDALLTNVYFLVVEGNAGLNPGKADLVVDLSSKRLGENGLLVIAAPGHPYTFPSETAVVIDAGFGTAGGALGNNSISFLLVASPARIISGTDLDGGDNGILEGLPAGARILDAVGWRDGNTNDIVYGGVMLTDSPQTPDAAVRFLSNSTPLSAAAWYFGDLKGNDGATLEFDEHDVSPNFPSGTTLTPGSDNRAAPQILPVLKALAAAIGDSTNPKVFFTVSDDELSPELIRVTATSTNPAVVPDANITITVGLGGERTLALDPIGVGYSLITVAASDGQMTNRAKFLYAASAQLSADTRHHVQCSDASAAIAIDSQLMFVGDDENQVLRIYRRHESGEPLAGFDMTPMLGLTDIENGRPREVDIEAATLVGRRIFWIGAHSHANIAEGRTNRSRVFATDWLGNGATSTLAYVGRYDYLKLDLVNWDASNLHGKGSNYFGLAASTAEGVNPKDPQGAGFNIEGLTMAPSSGEIGYVGFRAPIVPATNRTHALIVPVLNFATLATSDAPPGSAVFGVPVELDLYGRGIRSIERLGNNYLIVAGPPGDFPGAYPRDFRLYTWTGNPADRPQERTTDLTGLNPEAIVELPPTPWTAQSPIQLVSDCGRRVWYDDDIIAKLLKEPNIKKFRTDWVTLGAINKPVPVMVSAERGPNGTTIWWRALAGEHYRLQFKSALSDASWTDIAGDVQATGPFASKLDPAPVSAQRFYHVMLLP